VPRPDTPPLTRGVALRTAGFGLAVVLGVIAVWLISTSTTPKSLQLGVLAGLWGAILGAFTAFGRRQHDEPEAPAETGTELELRASGELDRADEAAARRAYEVRLEHMLRREINATMTREVASLRSEIAQLRQDLLEKVGGQLRLERIETTRLIGSDLEALQHEVRQLKQASTTGSLEIALGRLAGADLGRTRSVVEADVHTVERVDASVRPVQPTVEVREPIAPPPPPAPPEQRTPPPANAPAQQPAAPQPAAQQAAGPAAPGARLSPPVSRGPRLPQKADAAAPPRVAAPPPAAAPSESRPQQPARPAVPLPPPPPPPIAVGAARGEDPFASLPRIRPFTDFELDPIESVPAAAKPEREPEPAEGPRYTGRRRVADEIEAEKAAQAAEKAAEAERDAGRHSRGGEGGAEAPAGRRHRRADESDSGEDLLARLLAREGVQR
jgi:hypothetical protein